MQVRLGYEGSEGHPREDARLYRFELSTPDGKWLRNVRLSVSRKLQLSWKYDGRGDRTARFERAVLLLVLDEIQRLGPSLLDKEDPLDLKFGMDTHAALVEEANETGKDCEFQEARGRDLFCSAVLPPEALTDPKTHDATGRTSRVACETVCTLPDSRLLCSAFTHVGVAMLKRWPPHPILGPRVCDAGRDKEITEEANCTPGGHSCWHRVLDLGVATARPVEERGGSDVHMLSDREAAREYGEKAVGEAYEKISSAVAAARSQPMMALHRALPEAVRYLSSRLIDIYSALPEAAQKSGRDEFIETIRNRVLAFIESNHATYGRGPNAATVARLTARVGGDAVLPIASEFDLAVYARMKEAGNRPPPAAPVRIKQQKFGILDSTKDHFESDFKAGVGALGVSVIFFDLDKFKELNSKFSEPVVDERVLPQLQEVIRGLVDHRGFGYAEGGDEFIVVLPNTNTALAEAFTKELLDKIRSIEFVLDGETRHVTASAGIASSTTPDDWQECRVAAAKAKQAAKDAGRDQYVVSERRV